jgi:hypothetical protein
LATDLVQKNRFDFGFMLASLLLTRSLDQLVAQALMRSFVMIVLAKLCAKQTLVCLSKDDEMIKALLIDRVLRLASRTGQAIGTVCPMLGQLVT